MVSVRIPLTQDKIAHVSIQDAERVMGRRWHAVWCGWCFYARSGGTYLHRFIMEAKGGEQVDHEDRNGLNCVRANLRYATSAQNNQNKERHPRNTSGYKGVYWNKVRGKWMAYISKDGVRYNLGYYESLEEAARVYDAKARELHGEFARLNFPGENATVEMSTGKLRSDNIHGYRGISQTPSGKWKTTLNVNKRRAHDSLHLTAEEAARAYDEAARRHLGDKARLNFQ